jgi:hypothetical protein
MMGRRYMKIARLLILLATAGTGCATAANAEVATPYTDQAFHSSDTTYFGLGVYEDIESVGKCEVDRQPKKAATFVLTEAGSPQEQRSFEALFGNNVACLGQLKEMRVSRYAMRGAIAEALYKLPDTKQPVPTGSVALPDNTTVLIDRVAACYAQANPQDLRKFLETTKIATNAERRSFAVLASGFGTCIPAGVTMTFDPVRTRLALAEAAYRNSVRRTTSAGAPNPVQ